MYRLLGNVCTCKFIGFIKYLSLRARACHEGNTVPRAIHCPVTGRSVCVYFRQHNILLPGKQNKKIEKPRRQESALKTVSYLITILYRKPNTKNLKSIFLKKFAYIERPLTSRLCAIFLPIYIVFCVTSFCWRKIQFPFLFPRDAVTPGGEMGKSARRKERGEGVRAGSQGRDGRSGSGKRSSFRSSYLKWTE